MEKEVAVRVESGQCKGQMTSGKGRRGEGGEWTVLRAETWNWEVRVERAGEQRKGKER